jgi:hypothetical protein
MHDYPIIQIEKWNMLIDSIKMNNITTTRFDCFFHSNIFYIYKDVESEIKNQELKSSI